MPLKTDDYRDEIIDMYCNKRMTTVEIGKELGFCDSTVGRFLRRNNIPIVYSQRNKILTNEQEKDICARYKNGETTIEIGNKYNLCDRTVAKILRKNNVALRKAIRRSQITRHDYFEIIDSKEKAYFLGWMISDGSIVKPKTRPDRSRIISLELKSDDRYILEMFAKQLGALPDIVKDFKKRSHSHIRFASEKMAEDLSNYGVVVRKTMANKLPVLSNDLMSHMIRGYFDGNGTISIDKRGIAHFGFYGSEEVCTQIRDILAKELGFNRNKVSKSTCFHVWYGGNGVALKLFNYLYKDCDVFYLKRKFCKFKEVI